MLQRLRDAGNTIVVVEHDPDVIRAADLVLDMGPGAGERGGQIVFFGELPALLQSTRSLTAQYLTGKKKVEARRALGARGAAGPAPRGQRRAAPTAAHPHPRRGGAQPQGHRRGHPAGQARLRHRRQRLRASPPSCRTCCTTRLRALKHKPVDQPGKHRAIAGHELVDDVVLVDQSPIGRTARSNPVSYVGAFDAIRKLFAAEPLSRERGYTAGTFSFNAGNGRCPTCSGSGFEHIEMQFLSDVYLRCPDCDGRRFRQEVLDVRLFPPGAAARGPARRPSPLPMSWT